MLCISWIEKKTNEVLGLAKTRRSFIETIRKRRLKFFGHIIRKAIQERVIATGKIHGKKARRRQRMTYISNLSNTVGNIDNIELIRKVDDKENW